MNVVSYITTLYEIEINLITKVINLQSINKQTNQTVNPLVGGPVSKSVCPFIRPSVLSPSVLQWIGLSVSLSVNRPIAPE